MLGAPRVDLRFARSGAAGGDDFAKDLRSAVRAAALANDTKGKTRIIHLVTRYLGKQLFQRPPAKLRKQLDNSAVWKSAHGYSVLKTGEPPCVAFTYIVSGAGDVELVGLAVCHCYPNASADDWWNNVVLPRLAMI